MSSASEIPVGAVLSDKDIKAEMKKAKDENKPPLIADENGKPLKFDGEDAELLQPSCVDLRVHRIYLPGGGRRVIEKEKEEKKKKEWLLPPGAIVHIDSRERITTPPHIMAFLIPKNRKSEEGLLMLNAGHVDPNWENGFLTAELMNVTVQDYPIIIGEPIFSVVFVYMHAPAENKPKMLSDKERMERAKLLAAARPISLHKYYADRVLHEDFATKEEVRAAGIKGLTIFVIILSTLGALAMGVYLGIWLWQNTGPLPPLPP